ncbi:MAG: triphosphoribosyl-dephospho-CoA synthase [Erysipelotrichaceae bacterium]|nr:triphosphoribosyl-dephospho-CoA synthase [Erysipelotrichaceae bacterium]
MITEEGRPFRNRQRQELEQFLNQCGLEYDPSISYSVVLRDDETNGIIASGSLSGCLLKCVAVREDCRGQGLLPQVMDKLYEEMYLSGNYRFGGFTKPEKRTSFTHVNLYPVIRTEDMVMVEYGRGHFSGELQKIRTQCADMSGAQRSAFWKDLMQKPGSFPLCLFRPEEIPHYFLKPEKAVRAQYQMADALSAAVHSAVLGGDDMTFHTEYLIRYALRAEVMTTPKPGLVDLNDSGAHTDMDFALFMKSTDAVAPYLTVMFETGRQLEDLRDVFASIRKTGIEAEHAMFEATAGVNTHKGMIFSMGIIAASAGYCLKQRGHISADRVLELSGLMCAETLQEDFRNMEERDPVTHGEKLYRRYGEKGIRGEAMKGFPVLGNTALPVMRMSRDEDDNRRYLRVLMAVMSRLQDTNILTRGSYEDLAWLKQEAGKLLPDPEEELLKDMNKECIRKNISPGGAADMLACTILLDGLEQSSEEYAAGNAVLPCLETQ